MKILPKRKVSNESDLVNTEFPLYRTHEIELAFLFNEV